MEQQKVQGVDFFMIAWQVLDDELTISHSSMSDTEEAAIKETKDYLAKRYMNKAVSSLKCGKKEDEHLEFMSEKLLQRIAAFNEPIHWKPKDQTTEQPKD